MPEKEINISSIKTMFMFLSGMTCSEMLFNILGNAYDNPMQPEEKASLSLAGGIKQHGYQCGMIWGAALAAGARAYELHRSGDKAEAVAISAAQKLVESFRSQNQFINCEEITHLDKSSSNKDQMMYFIIKGGTIGCARMAAKFAPEALIDINEAFLEEITEAPSKPVSCAALLARKMGASEKHQVMAAGLAGGIGLCGGACGALGAAIWLMGVKTREQNRDADLWKDEKFATKFETLIEKFLENSDYEFECSHIVGRKFEDAADHAGYLKNGGCSKIIEVLANV